MRSAIAAGAISAFAIGVAIAAGAIVDDELELVRGVRVSVAARKALGGESVASGALTIVRETESAKYPFLNKKRYVVNTASTARAGAALVGTDDEDKARADRHAEARRKGSLRERRADGSWRATVAEKTTSAELTDHPPPVEREGPLVPTLLSVALGFAALFVLRLKLGDLAAALAGVVATAIALLVLLERSFAAASAAATTYLAGAAAVKLPVLALRIWIIALALVTLAIVALALSERGLELGRRAYKDRSAYAALAPAMLGLFVLVGLPFAYGIGLSFFEHVHGTFTFVGLQNFARILSPPDRPLFAPGSMLYALFVNVVWTLANVTLHAVIGLALALLLQKRAAKLSKLYRVFLIIPWAVPAYLTALIWKSMFDPDVGAINRMLGLEGMSWMHSAPTAFLANLATNVWLGFPFMMVVSLGALTSIPKDLYEAAEVDGASATAQLFRITLPLLQPALLPAIILGSIWTFNRFEIIYLVSEGRPDGATDILVTEAYRWAFERGLAQGGAYGYAAAYSVVIFAVLLVYGWMTSRVAKAAEEALR